MIDWWIIEKSLKGTLSAAEQEEFRRWLDESAAHVQWYEKIKHAKPETLDTEKAILLREAFRQTLKNKGRQVWMRRVQRWGSVAAAMVLLALGIYWWSGNREPAFQPRPYMAYQEPDRSKVRLYTGEGRVVDLSAVGTEDTLVVDGIKVAKDQGILSYKTSGAIAVNTENRIEVPRGAEFRLTLSDGTLVWLNSDSRFTYPVTFTGKYREVQLEGEAYFQVSRNEAQPFRVHTQGMDVVVLGTEFNVNTRQPEQVQTTLVRGKVGVETVSEKPVVLQPGEMASTNVLTGRTQKEQVNVERFVAWRYGAYCFEDATMEEILTELGLWYDVEIEYRNEQLRRERFSGYLPRGESITSILHKIEQTTYVHFTVTGNRIVVKY